MNLYKQQKLKVYNSLSVQKELFKPIVQGSVGMYVCGPTVYSNVHLGNVRTFVSFDIIYRYLKHLGYKVRYVRNITDVGHLENDDIDQGEDKISKRARIEQIEPMEIVQRYTIDFHQVLQKLNCLPPNIEPTATGHIVEQIETIKSIIEKGFAYEINGSVYFDVFKYNEHYQYGILNNRKVENLIHNTRELEGQSDKKNPQDFALWKKADAKHIMSWTSPWGKGFPGWHLECTTMSSKYLGKQIDIHGGGIDLKFPHHECEIAQGRCLHDENPVKYWLHTNMLTLNGKKMAKSTGNNILPNDIFSGNNSFLEKAISSSVTRFFMLQAHYRNVLDFSNEAIKASEKGYTRLIEALKLIEKLPIDINSDIDVYKMIQKCYDAMNDDFNTPILIAELFDIAKVIYQINDGSKTITKKDKEYLHKSVHTFLVDILGLSIEEQETVQNKHHDDMLTQLMEILISIRDEARASKNFALSDKIRNELINNNIQVEDGKEGTTFSIK